MLQAAVPGGFDRRVEPSGLRAHLAYLVTTVVALHVAGYCWLIARPLTGSPFTSRPVMQLRFIHRPAPTPVPTPVLTNPATTSPEAPTTLQPAVLPLSTSEPLSETPSPPVASLASTTAPTTTPTTTPAPTPTTAPATTAVAPPVAATATAPVATTTAATTAAIPSGAPRAAPVVSGPVPTGPTADERLERALAAAPALDTGDDSTLLADLQAQAQTVAGDMQTDGANEYLPRSMLTQGPQALAPVIIDFPLQVGQVGRFSTVLALFIDETGRVRRIRIDGTPLPEPFDAAARRSFESARFRPGQLHGQDVKSLIRIEVTFQSTPLDVEHGVKSLNFAL